MAYRDEIPVALKFKEKGYKYVLVIEGHQRPLYVMSLDTATRLMREDYSQHRFTCFDIDHFIHFIKVMGGQDE